MDFRTDLALEKHEQLNSSKIDGVKCETRIDGTIRVTTIDVLDENGEKQIGKPIGKYVTLEVESFLKNSVDSENSEKVLSDELTKMLPEKGTVLVVGLGNKSITPDALGPKSISLLLATRHISSELAKSAGLGDLRPVAGISPGVLGQTGIETAEIIEAVSKRIKPCAVIVIDALASRKLSRLGTTVQMTDTGISPGSGVGNRRVEISQKTLGIPVIAIGVPTVVDGATMAFDLLENAGIDFNDISCDADLMSENFMMVTPKEIDLVIERASQFIAMGINCAMQKSLSASEIMAIVK